MKWLIFFIFLIPCAFAYDCSQFSGVTYSDCITLSEVNESLIANLVYTSHFIPNHDFIRSYNDMITVSNPPFNTTLISGSYVKDAWISILTINPSIIFNDTLFVGNVFTIRSEYNYRIQIPAQYNDNTKKSGRTCKIIYSLSSQSSSIVTKIGDVSNSGSKLASFVIFTPASAEASVSISAIIQSDAYTWKYSNKNWKCTLKSTSYSTETITPKDFVQISPRLTVPITTAQIGSPYLDTQKILINDSGRNFILSTDNASLEKQTTYFSAKFTKSPYNFIQIYAQDTNETKSDNVLVSNQLAVPKTLTCSIESYDYFNADSEKCLNSNVTVEKIKTDAISKTNWYPLVLLLVITFVCYGIYRLIKATWGKYFLTSMIVVLAIPSAFASDCGLTNLGSCIPESIFNFIMGLINAPLEPLLSAINYFLTQPVSIDLFFSIWQIAVYILSFFYVIVLAFAGFKFMTSGHDVLKREQSKEWLQNAILAIVFTTASFYIYQLVIEVSASVTQGLMAMIPDTFFKITIDNISNIALESMYTSMYLIILTTTVIIFCLRYILVSISVIFAPFGVFCYFVPPLKNYGHLILQLIGILNAIPIACGLVALACSKMITIDFFASTKILLMMSTFFFMDLIVVLVVWHIVNASGLKGVVDKTISAGKYIAALVA